MPRRPTVVLTAVAALAAMALSTLVAVGAAPAIGTSEAAPAKGRVLWLCHPRLAHNACEIPLDTTYQHTGRASRVSTPPRRPSRQRPVDCFYVYPTISNDKSRYAALRRSAEVRAVTSWQAARFSPSCRMFAPVYRQATMASLVASMLGLPREPGPGYDDVRAAWRRYLAHDNHGRGVVLLGHSQGAFVLRQLIADEIDARPDIRDRIVGALLLGGNVEVARRRTTGGDFDHLPLCTRKGQAGCVVAYSTYGGDPGSDARFGNSRELKQGREVACTDPARLAGRSRAPVAIIQPSAAFPPGLFKLGVLATYELQVPSAATTWVSPSGRYVGGCRRIDGVHVLRYRPTEGSRQPREFPPSWGTHLIDFNLELQNLTRIVRLQSRTWLRTHR